MTFAGVTLGALVTGSLVVETVFAWPGLGKLAVDALFALDYAVLQAVVRAKSHFRAGFLLFNYV